MSGRGVFFYLGMTGSGKTYKALQDLRSDVDATGWPTLILDLMPSSTFLNLPHEVDVDRVLEKLYDPRKISGAVYTPRRDDYSDFDAIMRALQASGRVHVLVDECFWVASWRRIRLEFSKALRAWRHAGGVGLTWRVTTQRPGDLHADMRAVSPTVYAFATDGSADLRRLEQDYSFPPGVLKSLKRGEFCTYGSALEIPK